MSEVKAASTMTTIEVRCGEHSCTTHRLLGADLLDISTHYDGDDRGRQVDRGVRRHRPE